MRRGKVAGRLRDRSVRAGGSAPLLRYCGAGTAPRGHRTALHPAGGRAGSGPAMMACAELLAVCLLPAKLGPEPRREPLPIFHDVSAARGPELGAGAASGGRRRDRSRAG